MRREEREEGSEFSEVGLVSGALDTATLDNWWTGGELLNEVRFK